MKLKEPYDIVKIKPKLYNLTKDLKGLEDETLKNLRNSKAQNTLRAYASDFRHFTKFCIDNNFFKNDIYNALSGNFTVNQILKKIRKIKKKIKITFVKSKIMNQLSYHVNDTKLKNEGLKLNSNLEKDIKDTLNLFNYLKQ